jgi:hypothetical protein
VMSRFYQAGIIWAHGSEKVFVVDHRHRHYP